ncbi:MAG TPA: TrbI/VirB10 family protein [Terriglobales bacterium]|nr:TrbI/VirB10 family protein [Terriglobales bacterium]
MRALLTVLLVSGMTFGQAADSPKAAETPVQASTATQASATDQSAAATQSDKPATGKADKPSPLTSAPAGTTASPARDPNALVIPAGSKIPLSLAQAISTKNAREGDAVYAQTVFPFVLNDRVLVPAGTYIQGKISHTEPAGRSKKRAEILIHFTTLIYPSGYTVMLPASVENTPGADDKGVKDSEGTIQQDKDTGKRVEDAAKDAAVAGTVGSIGGVAAGGLSGARIGGAAGLAAGVAWALLKHGPELKLDVGTSIEMEIQRDITVDASRIQVAKAGS